MMVRSIPHSHVLTVCSSKRPLSVCSVDFLGSVSPNGQRQTFFSQLDRSDSSTTNRGPPKIMPASSQNLEDSLARIAKDHPIVLAQMNYARLLAPMEEEQMKEFALAMDPINQLAKSTPGFVWSFDNDDDGQRDAVDLLRNDPLIQPQLSLWKDMKSLQHFVFKSGHAMYYKRKKEWFSPPTPETTPYSVCWWYDLRSTAVLRIDNAESIRSFEPPNLKEAFERCHYLKVNGPTKHAFDFASHTKFPMPDCYTSSSS